MFPLLELPGPLTLQATFLRSASTLSTAKVQNPELEAELMGLSEDDLSLKCRRSGLSRKGDRAAQVGRCTPPQICRGISTVYSAQP